MRIAGRFDTIQRHDCLILYSEFSGEGQSCSAMPRLLSPVLSLFHIQFESSFPNYPSQQIQKATIDSTSLLESYILQASCNSWFSEVKSKDVLNHAHFRGQFTVSAQHRVSSSELSYKAIRSVQCELFTSAPLLVRRLIPRHITLSEDDSIIALGATK